MSYQAGSKTTIDSNFVETIKILNKHDVPYWVCHGTLLGLVRDGNLIPWDHDIDIAIWFGDFSKKELINLMKENNYALKSDGSDYDFVSFSKKGGREVDFNFYRRTPETDMAYSEWFISKSKLTSLLSLISAKSDYEGAFSWWIKKLYVFSPIASLIVRFLKKRGLLYVSAGYTTPASLLKDIKYIELNGLKVNVPVSHDDVLKFLYGEDWKTPKQQFDWTTESPATRVSNTRFN